MTTRATQRFLVLLHIQGTYMPQSNDTKPDFSNADMTVYDLPRPINPVLPDDPW